MGLAFPKPEPRKRTKAREDRREAAIEKDVRAAVAERDGFCRVATCLLSHGLGSTCAGESEWAHLEGKRRFETRGQDPLERHDRAYSLMLCTKHHGNYDDRKLQIIPLTTKIADGRLAFTSGGILYRES